MSVAGRAGRAAPMAVNDHWRRSLVIGTLGALMLLAGCTKVGPDFVKPDAPIAEQWTETGELQLIPTQTDHADWWNAFVQASFRFLILCDSRDKSPKRWKRPTTAA